MARNRRPKSKPAAIVPPAATTGRSVEELRLSIVRKLELFTADWRGCARGICQRRRACNPPDDGCLSPRRREQPMTDEEWARRKAQILRVLRRRRDELAAARGESAAD